MFLKAVFETPHQTLTFNLAQSYDLSIPLQNGSLNPNCYRAEPPKFEIIRSDSFIGSVALGGPCNYQKITLTPHGNGTHTECYGHITDEMATINALHKHFFSLAQLISLEPKEYQNDKVIFWEQIEPLLFTHLPIKALIIRTLPNDKSKKTRCYTQTNPPYLDSIVGKKLFEQDILHLLVDLPSVDKESDGGKLATHRAFWGYPNQTRKNATITELIFVDNAIPDGVYLLNLQIISLESDASPSKPLIFPLLS